MPRPIRRRATSAEINRLLQSPALVTAPRPVRRAVSAWLRQQEPVSPWNGEG